MALNLGQVWTTALFITSRISLCFYTEFPDKTFRTLILFLILLHIAEATTLSKVIYMIVELLMVGRLPTNNLVARSISV